MEMAKVHIGLIIFAINFVKGIYMYIDSSKYYKNKILWQIIVVIWIVAWHIYSIYI